jgi:hypothetical protein
MTYETEIREGGDSCYRHVLRNGRTIALWYEGSVDDLDEDICWDRRPIRAAEACRLVGWRQANEASEPIRTDF